ncbi:MAG: hypothetical protein ABW082_04545 [Sedimenticola sp.]
MDGTGISGYPNGYLKGCGERSESCKEMMQWSLLKQNALMPWQRNFIDPLLLDEQWLQC